MGGRSGQIAIVLILGGALLIYGGATGRLGAAWTALSGGSTGTPAVPPPASGEPEPGQDGDPTPGEGQSRAVAMVRSQASTGQMITRPGGYE